MIRQFIHKLRNSKGHGGVLARGAIGVFIVKVTGAGLLFGLHIMLARILGPQHYGIYVYAVTWLNILAILSLLGFQTSLVRFMAEYTVKQQWSLLRGLLRRSQQFVLGFSVVISVSGAVFVWIWLPRLSNELAVVFYVAFYALPFCAVTRLRESSLRGLKKVVQSELLLRVMGPLLTGIIAIGLFLWQGGGFDARYAMMAHLIAIVCTAVTGTFFLRSLLPRSVGQTPPEFASKLWLKVSLPLLLIGGMQIILKTTDIVMLGLLNGSEQAGLYSAASKVSDLVIFALMAMNVILGPLISELHHTGQKERLQRVVVLATRTTFAFTLFASMILSVFGKFVLSLFGPAFVAVFIPLLILLFGQIVNSLAGSVGLIMAMTGRQNAMGVIITTSAGVNILLNIILIPMLGLTGAAISTAATMIIWNVAMFIYVRNRIGINSTAFGYV